jgi:hypothetical protein
MIDFAAVRGAVCITQVAEWLGVELKKEPSGFRGRCPACGSDDARSLFIDPAKQIFTCHGKCPPKPGKEKAGGDCIELASRALKLSMPLAAQEINKHFRCTTPPNKPVPIPDDELKPLDYLVADHPLGTELGFSKEYCERMGAGYAPRGTMAGYFLEPRRNEKGKLIAYVGINPHRDPPVKLPKSWRW